MIQPLEEQPAGVAKVEERLAVLIDEVAPVRADLEPHALDRRSDASVVPVPGLSGTTTEEEQESCCRPDCEDSTHYGPPSGCFPNPLFVESTCAVGEAAWAARIMVSRNALLLSSRRRPAFGRAVDQPESRGGLMFVPPGRRRRGPVRAKRPGRGRCIPQMPSVARQAAMRKSTPPARYRCAGPARTLSRGRPHRRRNDASLDCPSSCRYACPNLLGYVATHSGPARARLRSGE